QEHHIAQATPEQKTHEYAKMPTDAPASTGKISISADERDITTPSLSSQSDANAKIEPTPREQIPTTPQRKRELRTCFNCEQQGYVQSACTAPQASPMTLYNRHVKYAKE